jgi:hypothetical protein
MWHDGVIIVRVVRTCIRTFQVTPGAAKYCTPPATLYRNFPRRCMVCLVIAPTTSFILRHVIIVLNESVLSVTTLVYLNGVFVDGMTVPL